MEHDWWQQHLKQTAARLVELSRLPGWVDYARHEAKTLMQSELYRDLPALMREAMSASNSHTRPASTATTEPSKGES